MDEHALSTLREIKKRLDNLRAQKMCIPSTKEPLFPFFSAIDLLNKISSEEEYLHKEAARIKKTLPLHSSGQGKDSYSPEVWTVLYPDR